MDRFKTLVVGVIGLAALGYAATPDTLPNPFASGNFTRDWARTSKLASVRGSELVLDAMRGEKTVAVFRQDKAFIDTTMAATFRVERVGKGDQAFGLIFGSSDGHTYYAFEIDRNAMSLVRVRPGQGPETLVSRRIPSHEGQWSTMQLKCKGGLFRGTYGGQVLEMRNIPDLKAGRIGAYARDGRAQLKGLEFSGKPARLSQGWQLHPPAKPPAPR